MATYRPGPYDAPPAAASFQPNPIDERAAYAAELRRIYGLDDPQPAPEEFQVSGLGSFLEDIGPSLQGIQAGRPRNFGEGALVGLAQGLGAAGSRVGRARQKFEGQQSQRMAKADAARLEATRAMRGQLAGYVTGAAKDRVSAQSKAAEDQAKRAYEQSPEYMAQITAEEKAKEAGRGEPADPLVKVQGKNGPVWMKRSDAVGKPAASDVGASTLTPEQAALLGGLIKQGGAFPPLGRGGIGSPVGQAILGSMLGSDPTKTPQQVGQDLAGQRATQAATTGSLKDIEKALSQQSVFTKKLKLNTDRLRGTMKKIADTGSPLFNGPIRNVMNQLGSADQAAFHAALVPVATESARLLNSGPTLGGQLSDSARNELLGAEEGILSGSFSVKQLNAVLDILENDAQNGINMYTEQRDALREQVRGGASGSAQSRVSTVPAGAKKGGFFEANAPGGQ